MGYDIREIANEDIYSREIAETAYADKLFQVLHKDQLHERVAVIVAKEGDINSAQRVLDFYQVMKDRLFKRSVSKLVIIYPDEDSIHYDTYNCHFDKSVLVTDYESLTESRKVIFNQYINMNSTKIRGYL
ncbi:hypothetical protein QNH47_00860 [Virgibacillus halodenitrificans]|uniref:hypothetical protein n=1 Tax=Virgibacillus halodenitrificans TaxID=1482 RepID=UPI0024C003F0|nr:hypothetical protein [Virgibacillus halodenitrificans]WHX26435.1 hypothetical protein QNH47_00860 [Virgibacillus halodenitrificans]